MKIDIPDEIIELHKGVYRKGTLPQLRNKTVEECAELITAIHHQVDGKVSINDTLEECADVIICATFLMESLADGIHPQRIIDKKLTRLSIRLAIMKEKELDSEQGCD